MLIDYDVALLLASVSALAGLSFDRGREVLLRLLGRPVKCDATVPERDAPISDLTDNDN